MTTGAKTVEDAAIDRSELLARVESITPGHWGYTGIPTVCPRESLGFGKKPH